MFSSEMCLTFAKFKTDVLVPRIESTCLNLFVLFCSAFKPWKNIEFAPFLLSPRFNLISFRQFALNFDSFFAEKIVKITFNRRFRHFRNFFCQFIVRWKWSKMNYEISPSALSGSGSAPEIENSPSEPSKYFSRNLSHFFTFIYPATLPLCYFLLNRTACIRQ